MFLPGVFETNIVTDKSSTDSTPIEPTTPVTPTVPVEISPTFKFRTSISLNADGSNKISEFHTFKLVQNFISSTNFHIT